MPVTPKQAVSLRILALCSAIEAHKKIDNSSRSDQLDGRNAILDTTAHFEALLRAPLEEAQLKAAPPAETGPLDDAEAHFAVQICTETADFLDRTPHPFVNQRGDRGRIWESDRTRLVDQLHELIANVSRPDRVVGTPLDEAVRKVLTIALQLLRVGVSATAADNPVQAAMWAAKRNSVIAQLTSTLNLDLTPAAVPVERNDVMISHDLIIALQLLKAGRHAPTIGDLPDAAEDAHDWAHERDRVVGTLTEAFSIDLTSTDGIGREL